MHRPKAIPHREVFRLDHLERPRFFLYPKTALRGTQAVYRRGSKVERALRALVALHGTETIFSSPPELDHAFTTYEALELFLELSARAGTPEALEGLLAEASVARIRLHLLWIKEIVEFSLGFPPPPPSLQG